jgi:hypothetical protein
VVFQAPALIAFLLTNSPRHIHLATFTSSSTMLSTASTFQMHLDWRPVARPTSAVVRPRLAALATLTVGLAASPLSAQAQDVQPSQRLAQAAHPATNPAQRLSAQYLALAGSADNVTSLVQGLRLGRRISLSDAQGQVEFMPITRPMAWGDVEAALALACTSLAQVGIQQPGAQHWSIALNGGTLATASGEVVMSGVLAQRASGMGWGQIAQSMGTTLGRVMDAHRSSGPQSEMGAHSKLGAAG